MQRIMQILHEDHINVAGLLDLMERALERLPNKDPVDLALASNTMRYMTAYPDIYHHPLEDIVFRHLLKRSPETGLKIHQLFEEHVILGTTGNEFLGKIKTAIERPSDPLEDLINHGLEYVGQLRAHMNTEEGEIFPLINVVLSTHDWGVLDESIAVAKDPLFGSQVQKSYQNLAEALLARTR